VWPSAPSPSRADERQADHAPAAPRHQYRPGGGLFVLLIVFIRGEGHFTFDYAWPGPKEAPPTRRSFGTRIESLGHQLNGQAQLTIEPVSPIERLPAFAQAVRSA
jgi:hypothetical protein